MIFLEMSHYRKWGISEYLYVKIEFHKSNLNHNKRLLIFVVLSKVKISNMEKLSIYFINFYTQFVIRSILRIPKKLSRVGARRAERSDFKKLITRWTNIVWH